MLNSINIALQNVSTKTTDFKPYRISDLIPRNLEGGNEQGEFRSFMSDLHLWMQAWSDQGEKMLAMVESIDRFDNNVIAFDPLIAQIKSSDQLSQRCTRSFTGRLPMNH